MTYQLISRMEESPVGGILTANYGGGTNSGAMLIGMVERDIVPTVIHFADTGRWLEDPAEKPETYHYIEMFSGWLAEHGMPTVTVVRHKSDTLYNSCSRNGTLPSKAYGFPGCSVKFKHQIIEANEKLLFGPDAIITKAIGYHANEDRGSSITESGRYRYRYFLKEWGWRQEECEQAFRRHGLPVPPKSSCYFCPAMRPHEIIELKQVHPALFDKAVAMEHNAKPYHAERGNVVKGLGRNWSWEGLVKADEAQSKLFSMPPEMDTNCVCFDGDMCETEAA